MNWIKGPRYDYPEGYPTYSQSLFADFKLYKEPYLFFNEEWVKIKKNIPKACHRYRWMVAKSTFRGKEHFIDIDFLEGEHIPMRTIKYILKNDRILKGIKKHNQ